MSASRLIHSFSSHPVALRLLASSPANNISLNPVNKNTDQDLSSFHTGIGATAHATFDTKQLNPHTRTSFVDTTASPQGSDERLVTVSEVYELFTTIHTFWTVPCLNGLVIWLLF